MVELHIFTNCISVIETHAPIFRTVDSFKGTFGDIPIHVWCDKNPNINAAPHYVKSLKKQFNNLSITESLSDGYIKAVTQSKADFLFMLEHDWVFNNENVSHSLDEICDLMKYENIHHFKFSRFNNSSALGFTMVSSQYNHEQLLSQAPEWDDYNKAIEFYSTPVPYFTVKSASNNPHIINRHLYVRDLINRVKVEKGSMGIENNLRNVDNAKFAIYGDANLGPTTCHLDGRGVWQG